MMGGEYGFAFAPRLESDEEFRARLMYTTGDRVLAQLSGKQLDAFAEQYNLRRRKDGK